MLKGKIALVTGASRGVGRGIALQLGQAGATVYLTGRKPPTAQKSEEKGFSINYVTLNASDLDNSLRSGQTDDKSEAASRSKRIDQGLRELQESDTLEKAAKEVTERGGKGIVIYCDHSDPDQIESLFQQLERETNGQLDILVNNAYSAANALMKASGKKFWELDPLFWDTVNNVGLRNHYICSVYGARMMVKRGQGLIVTLSSAGGLQYVFNACYGVGKAAKDRLAADMAHELKPFNVASVSLWPGAVKTEIAMKIVGTATQEEMASLPDTTDELLSKPMTEMFNAGESTEFAGMCVAHLAADPHVMKKTGKILLTTDLASKYGFKDVDGKTPANMRSLPYLLRLEKHTTLAKIVPSGVKLPGWMLTAGTSQL